MPKNSPIRIVKMKSGESVICEYRVKGTKSTLKYPMAIDSIIVTDESDMDRVRVCLHPWISCSTTIQYDIPKSEILVLAIPDKTLIHVYLATRLESNQIGTKDFISELGSDLIDPKTKQQIFDDLSKESNEKRKDDPDDFPFFDQKSRFGFF